MTRTLYQTVMGDAFAQLPDEIKAMHAGVALAEGRADIVRGSSPLAKLICKLAHVPETGLDVPVVIRFDPIEDGERWMRSFNGQSFQTDVRINSRNPGAGVTEKFGPFLFKLRMVAHENGVDLMPESVSLWGLPLPKFLCPEAVGLERVREGRYHFDVSVRFPLAGEVLRYEGWLTPEIAHEKTGSVS